MGADAVVGDLACRRAEPRKIRNDQAELCILARRFARQAAKVAAAAGASMQEHRHGDPGVAGALVAKRHAQRFTSVSEVDVDRPRLEPDRERRFPAERLDAPGETEEREVDQK